MRAGTENIAGIVGMAIALKNNIVELRKNQNHINYLESLLLQKLKENAVPFVRNGGEHKLPGLISLSFAGKQGEAIMHRMDLMGISIATGSAFNSRDTEISHVLQAILLPENLARGTIRISLGKDNSEEDVMAIVVALKKIVS